MGKVILVLVDHDIDIVYDIPSVPKKIRKKNCFKKKYIYIYIYIYIKCIVNK